MPQRTVHDTIVTERTYEVAPDRVFAAWSDPATKRQWFMEGEGWRIEEYGLDFRVGGREFGRFRRGDGPEMRNDTVYLDIEPNRRIVMAYTMTVGGKNISASLGTVELEALGAGTRLIYTEQAAFFEGADGPLSRRNGWRGLFERLADSLGEKRQSVPGKTVPEKAGAEKIAAGKTRSTAPKTGVETGRVDTPPERPAELDRLNVFIGRWMTEGDTVAEPDAPSVPVVASDIYTWLPGSHFVMHEAYGRIGETGVGGLETVGFDAATGQFQCHFFDSQGNTTTQTLSYRDDAWLWQGTYARCTGVFTDDGKTLMARHERSDDGKQWVPMMTVVLRKID